MSSSYAPPIPLILEAIHVAPSRSPPDKVRYRGELTAWDGSITEVPSVSNDVETQTPGGMEEEPNSRWSPADIET